MEIQLLTVDEQLQTPETQQAIANGEDFRVVYPTDSERDPRIIGCRCFMSVTGVSNLLTVFENPNLDFQNWEISDANTSNGNNFNISGRDDTYSFTALEGSYIPIPSTGTPPLELNYPSDGSHMFYISSLNITEPLSDFTIHTTVRCYDQLRDGTSSLGTTTYHDFVWDEGVDQGGGAGFWLKAISKNFSCIWQTAKGPR